MTSVTSESTHPQRVLEDEVKELRSVLALHPQLYREFYHRQCVEALKRTMMFGMIPDELLDHVAKVMQRVEFPAGTMLSRVNLTLEDAYVIASGDLRRWAEVNGRQHSVQTCCDKSIGTLHLYNSAAEARFNAECLTDVVAYRIHRADLDRLIARYPPIAMYIIQAMSTYIRHQQKRYDTPLLEQKSHRTSFTSTTIAAFVESFYRSAMSNLINMRVTGIRGAWFPQMHIQAPIRICYINGIKQIRAQCDSVDATQFRYPSLARIGLSFAPGVLMCPFSSVLEASNVPADRNPESLSTRWMRGFTPRLVREVLFGIGINQLADFYSERFSLLSENTHLKYALGSICSGVTSGYFSHVPHIMSTQKLFFPHKSYSELWAEYWAKSMAVVPPTVPEPLRPACAKFISVAFPAGVVRRSVQISGTFIIINTLTYTMRNQNWY